MYGVVLAFHLLVSIALIGVVLIQSGKGGGLAGGAFGGATQTVFGGRGATDFITKATIYLGIIFFVTSLGLAILTAKGGPGGNSRSLIQEQNRKAAATQQQQGSRAPAGAPTGGVPAPGGPAAAPATGGK